MFSKKIGQEIWKSPKVIYRGKFSVDYSDRVYADIEKIKIYGYRFTKKDFYLYIKGDHKSMSNGKRVTAKTWRHSDASLCDKDKSFITQSMIEKYKKFIKDQIKKHQDYVDREEERIAQQKKYTQHRKQVVSAYQSMLDNNVVDTENFHWRARWNNQDNKVDLEKRPLNISEEIKKEETTYYL